MYSTKTKLKQQACHQGPTWNISIRCGYHIRSEWHDLDQKYKPKWRERQASKSCTTAFGRYCQSCKCNQSACQATIHCDTVTPLWHRTGTCLAQNLELMCSKIKLMHLAIPAKSYISACIFRKQHSECQLAFFGSRMLKCRISKFPLQLPMHYS